jgi:hemerythrin-like metal-binding protein
MALITWDESLSVGIESIDKQHMKLVDMINEFYESIRSKSTEEVLSDLIKHMREYVVFHFNSEEELLKLNRYPDYLDHKIEHEMFVNKVEDFEKRFNSGQLILSFEITNFLKSWLKNHIQGTDKKYSDFLISRGVK